MPLTMDEILQILLSILAGGAIGLEREFRDKAAGFRTLIFICVGAALFTIFSIRIGAAGDPGRIAAGLVTGVGFLGAGAIMKEGSRVVGLTTAATIWFVAALGMGFGAGEYALTLFMTLIGLVVLWIFPSIEHRIDNVREEREYEIAFAYRPEKFDALETLFGRNRLRIIEKKHCKSGPQMACTWRAAGPPAAHESLVRTLLADPDIQSIRF